MAPSTAVFPKISIDSIERKLDLTTEAEKRGKDNQPPPDAPGLDSLESRVIEEVNAVRHIGLNTYNNEMRMYAERISSLDVDGFVAQISVAIANGIANLKGQAHAGVNHLYNQLDQLRELKDELAHFRQVHRLRRAARYPRSHVLGVGVILIILVLEGILNGTFFMEANELGLVGGAITAIVIAGINIGFAFFFGRGCIFVNHRNFAFKAFGVLCLLGFVAVLFGLNLFVGHFREAVATNDWETATRTAVGMFTDNPIRLTVFNSWILVLLGLLFGLATFVDALKWDDPYPGFGNLWRRWREAVEDYAAEMEARLDELSESKDACLEEIRQAREEIATRVRNYFQAAEFRAGLIQGLPVFLEETERAANHLLAKYREINRKSRSADAPPHFAQRFQFGPVDTGPPGENTTPAIGKLTESADQVLVESTKGLMEAYKEAFEEYQRIPRLVQELNKNETPAAAS